MYKRFVIFHLNCVKQLFTCRICCFHSLLNHKMAIFHNCLNAANAMCLAKSDCRTHWQHHFDSIAIVSSGGLRRTNNWTRATSYFMNYAQIALNWHWLNCVSCDKFHMIYMHRIQYKHCEPISLKQRSYRIATKWQ